MSHLWQTWDSCEHSSRKYFMNFGAVWWIVWFVFSPSTYRDRAHWHLHCVSQCHLPSGMSSWACCTVPKRPQSMTSLEKLNLRLQMKPLSLACSPSPLSYWCFPNPQVWSVHFPFEMDHFLINFTVNPFPVSFVPARWTRWFPSLCDTTLGTGAQTIPSLHHILHSGISSKEG